MWSLFFLCFLEQVKGGLNEEKGKTEFLIILQLLADLWI